MSYTRQGVANTSARQASAFENETLRLQAKRLKRERRDRNPAHAAGIEALQSENDSLRERIKELEEQANGNT